MSINKVNLTELRALSMTDAQKRVLRRLGAPGLDRASGRACFGADYRVACKLEKMGFAQLVSFRVYRITPAGERALEIIK